MHEPDRRAEDFLMDLNNDEQLTELLRTLRCPPDVAPRPGFYAKVMDRIESQQKSSIWSVFLEPVFSKRLAFASAALIVLMAVALFNAAPQDEVGILALDDGEAPVVFMDENQAAPVLGVDALRAAPVALMNADQSRDIVLVDLVSYPGN
jgi:hypothetical protein